MTRRITRTLTQGAALLILVLILLFLADFRYSVLPNALHTHSPLHHAGTVLTDITITTCTAPFPNCKVKDYTRVEKDLHLGAGWLQSAYVHIQRKREEDLTSEDKVVVGVSVGRPSVEDDGTTGGWEKRPGGLWVLRSSKRHDSDSEKAVTAVDVLFGTDVTDPRPNWKLSDSPLSITGGGGGDLQPRLSVRHGQHKAESNVEEQFQPRVRKDGRFKILQISDAHLSTGMGKCRDAMGYDGKDITNCEADPRTLEFIELILDDEKPDLVILSGDQVEGPTSPDVQTTLFKITAPLIQRKIPHAAIFGNHDDEKASSRRSQMALLQTLPYSLSHPGPEAVDGVGNYYIEVLGSAGSQHSALTIYMLDTHAGSPDEKKYWGYDWIKPSQIEWFKSTAEALRSQSLHKKYSHIHLDLAFIHIPLPEFGDRDNKFVAGQFKEPITAPGFNSHFYDALAEEGIVAVGAGHDHVNDYCALSPTTHPSSHAAGKTHHQGPWMCYAGASGFGGYGQYNGEKVHRRLRVWEVDTNAGKVMTWKRVECCSAEERGRKVDEVVLVEGGVVVGPG